MIRLKRIFINMANFIRLITVEPTMMLYMMAFMITNVVELAFFLNKACTVNHNLTEAICSNLTAHKELNAKVQRTYAEFHQWNDIAGHIGQVVLALFMGAWSDKHGRKLPLIIGLVGKFYYSLMIVINSLHPTWPVEYIIYTATIPMSLTGADVAIFAACFSYISDVSLPESRTLRVTILEVCYLATMPTGIAIGKVIYNHLTHSHYTVLFGINSSLLFLSIIYSLIFLRWRTSPTQQALWDSPNIFKDFFDPNHVWQTLRAIGKKRPQNRRTYLILLIIAMSFYTFQRDEKGMSHVYLQLVLGWSLSAISDFRTYQSALQDVALLTVIPLLSKLCKWKDASIMMFGSICHSLARVFFITGIEPWWFYLGGFFGGFGPIVAPLIRSMVSKLVSVDERGKVFSVLAVMDNATPMVSSTVYSQVYNTTGAHPTTIFYVTIASQMVVLMIATFIRFRAKDHAMQHVESMEDIESSVEAVEKM